MTDPVVVLAGGGTAGHVNPLLALAEQLRTEVPGIHLPVLGTAEGLEADLVPAAGLDLTTIEKVPLPRTITPQWLSLPRRWRRAMASTRELVAGADAVVGFGGYVSAPAYLAARRANVPIVVHEQNARPGLANRLGARYAATVGVTFPGTPLRGGHVVGLPLRAAITELLAQRSADAAGRARAGARALGLDPERLTVVVTGGSLGAARLNQMLPTVGPELIDAGAQVLHLTGRDKAEPTRAAVAQMEGREHYHVREYLIQMEHALACADLVIARAGAGTVSELTALGIPAVYVPLPIGNGEQALNARPVVTAGGALMVDDAALTTTWLSEHLLPLVRGEPGRARREQMRAAADRAAITDGAQRLATMVIDVLGRR